MKIEIKQITPWSRALDAARWTVNKDLTGKEPSDAWKSKMLIAEHSPIRLVEYDIFIKDAPNKVINHLVRHHEGCEKFVGTHRSDRSDSKDLEVNRLTPTNLLLSSNAQGILNISYKRLCGNAEKETVKTWNEVKKEMQKVDSVLASKMVPQCVRLGYCPELKCCGFIKSKNYQILNSEYHKI